MSKTKEPMSNPPPKIAPMAYENPLFLNSPDGRLLRIMSEYMEPFARFRREQIQDTVVFFGSARFRCLLDANTAMEKDRLSTYDRDRIQLQAGVEMARYYADGSRM